PFPYESYLSELGALRDQLKAGLALPQPAGEGGQPDTASAENKSSNLSELAESIKTLKAAHTIEAAPERSTKRQISAEEPVTARIRRRHALKADHAASPDAPSLSTALPAGTTHQDRLANTRQQKDSEPSLP